MELPASAAHAAASGDRLTPRFLEKPASRTLPSGGPRECGIEVTLQVQSGSSPEGRGCETVPCGQRGTKGFLAAHVRPGGMEPPVEGSVEVGV